MDWTPIFQAIISAVALLFSALAAIYVPRAIAAFEVATKTKVTDQQRAAVYAAVDTLKGDLQAKLNAGIIRPGELKATNSPILQAAADAIIPVKEAAAAQGVSVVALARLAVARVDTAPKAVVVLPPGAVLGPVS